MSANNRPGNLKSSYEAGVLAPVLECGFVSLARAGAARWDAADAVCGLAAPLCLTSGPCLCWLSAGGLLCYCRFTRCQLQHKLQRAEQHLLFQPHRLCFYWSPFVTASGAQFQPAGSLKAELSGLQSQGPGPWLDSAAGTTGTATIQFCLSIYFWFPACVLSACVTPHNVGKFWVFGCFSLVLIQLQGTAMSPIQQRLCAACVPCM